MPRTRVQAESSTEDTEVLRSLLEVGVNLSALADQEKMLGVILREARKLARAEAGTFYVVEGDGLRFAAAQNDRIAIPELMRKLVGEKMPIGSDSLAGFVAATGQIMNIPNTRCLPVGAPFRINLEFDAAMGYKTQSLLALPLTCPDGECVGVLELINHVDSDGRVGPFPRDESDGIRSLSAMAAVTIHNYLLQARLKQAHLQTILRLSVAAEFRDDDTGEHVRRISRSSALIAESLGLDAEQVELIQWASPMHDIGKIGIPDAILLKPGPLTAAERSIVETHAFIGGDILSNPQNELIAMAREVALSHHEKWSGQGYPRRLAAEKIPLSGRIVGLADVFDALICKRCYKEACPVDVAIGIISDEKGNHFDPVVVEAFFDARDKILRSYGKAEEQLAQQPLGD